MSTRCFRSTLAVYTTQLSRCKTQRIPQKCNVMFTMCLWKYTLFGNIPVINGILHRALPSTRHTSHSKTYKLSQDCLVCNMFVEFEDIPIINGILPLHQALLSVVIAQDCRLSVLMLLLTAPSIVTNFARHQLDHFLYCSICGVQPTLLTILLYNTASVVCQFLFFCL